MNVSKYKALLLAVDRGSFSKATEEMGYTQSGMTHMMNSLEEEIGFRVIERGYYGIRLTERGEKLMPSIRRMVRQTELLEEEIRRLRGEGSKGLRIGLGYGLAERLPHIMESVKRRMPELRIDMYTEGTSALYEGLLAGRYDAIFADHAAKYTVEWTPLAQEPLLLLLPPDESIEGGFSLKSLNGRDFLAMDMGCHPEALELLRKEGARLSAASAYVEPSALLAMVRCGLGVSVLPCSLLKDARCEVKSLPLPDAFVRSIGLALPPDGEKTECCEALLAAVKECKEKEAAALV